MGWSLLEISDLLHMYSNGDRDYNICQIILVNLLFLLYVMFSNVQIKSKYMLL